MKKIFLTLLVCASVAAVPSCIKDAEMTQYMTDDAKNELAAKDPDKVFAAAVAGLQVNMQSYVYSNVNHNYFGQKGFDYITSLMGNDMIMTGRFAMSLYHYQLDYWQENYVPTANRWREYYKEIDAANSILASIAEDETAPSVLRYKATAKTFRAYAYLQLTYLYQYSYYCGADDTKWGKGAAYDHSNDPCVPIVTETITGQQPRRSVADVYELILGDLEEAYAIFEQIGSVKTADPTDIDGCVAAMHLARAYMVKHDWPNALKYAQVIVDNFDVLRGKDILQGFSSITLPDIVYGCDITSDNSTIYMSWFSQMDMFGDGYAGIGVWRAGFGPTVDRISDTDVRLDWFYTSRNAEKLTQEFGAGPQVMYQSCKFIGGGRSNVVDGFGEGWELGDYIYLRSEEAYLMKAEILAHMNQPQEAVNVLNAFMQTRDPQYNCKLTAKADIIEEINFQKRIEFWGEGIEFLDNRRLNIPVDRTNETWGSRNNHLDAARFRYEQESRPFLYQLPQSEIENNSEISEDDQN